MLARLFLPFRRLSPRTTSLRAQGVEPSQLQGLTPLYDRRPPWWSRFTYLLVCADLAVTFSACELTWNHWTQWEALPDEGGAGDAKSKKENGQYVLRPWWQRLPFAGGQFFLGVAIAGLLLGSRTRVVRRIYVLPPGSTSATTSSTARAQALSSMSKAASGPDDRRIVLQCVHHLRSRGKVLPINHCALDKGQDESEVTIWVDGERGHYWAGLKDSTIEGQTGPIWQVRYALFKAWYDEGKAMKVRMEEGWRSGPAARQA